ncbi:MAG: BrnT family toxin [Anaerolineales bacterium]|nr:BrnT family toxin [Chloroflexota bacterium]MBL6979626.1 BrnT family toxin [Anaerolineales bacterium]
MEDFRNLKGFDWDDGNREKNWIKHQVSSIECEEIFFNTPLVLANDKLHSVDETRYYVLGQTNRERRLFIVFTVRDEKIRVISARDMSRKEHEIYEEANS